MGVRPPRDARLLKLVLDQGLTPAAAALLRERGHVASHVEELGLATAGDDEILAFARVRDAVIVTLDRDFHAVLAESGATKPSVIFLRAQRLTAATTVAAIELVCTRHAADLAAGAAVTTRGLLSRARRLPLRDLA